MTAMAITSCPKTWVRSAGSVGDTLVIEVYEGLGDNLDGVVTVSCLLEDVRGKLVDVSLTATVTDSANREVTVQLGTWLQNTAIAGQAWWVSLIITAGGTTAPWPEKQSDRLGLYIT